jgi:hypothetical protein
MKILTVLTSHDTLGNTGKRSSMWADTALCWISQKAPFPSLYSNPYYNSGKPIRSGLLLCPACFVT